MTRQEEERMNFLCREVEKHRHLYYNLNAPIISDKEFDKLFYELEELEKKTGVVLGYSPTKRAGTEPISKFKKVPHNTRMYSLDKAQNENELVDFLNRTEKLARAEGFLKDEANSEAEQEKGEANKLEYVVEHKFDGLSLDISYENGRFVRALTRGNGVVGEDVTEQARTIRTVPMLIPFLHKVDVQGEVVMKRSEFVKYNKSAADPLKNERNAASGAIRNLDPKITASRKLDFVAYYVNMIENKEFKTTAETRQFLTNNQFYTGEYFVCAKSLPEILNCVDEVNKNKAKLDISIDGLVIKLNDLKISQALGFTDRFPRGQIAYKFEAEETSTILKDVVWNVGRTGRLTPNAILEPVDIAGATVARATLNNLGDIVRKQVKINSRVLIRRSNEVIPEIMGTLEHYENSKEIEAPTVCPSCGNVLTTIGANLFCLNRETCKEQIVSKLTHFVSKHGMNVEGMSESTIYALYASWGVNHFADLYKLTKENFAKLEGFKDKKINNVLNAIESSKSVDLDRFIYAVGIEGVGRKMSKELARRFKSFDALKGCTMEELLEMPDIAEISATNILDFFKDKMLMIDIENLFKLGVRIKEPAKTVSGSTYFSDQKVVLTGSLAAYSRDEASAIIESLGGEIMDAVSGTTTLVIYGEKAGSKLLKAKEKNIKTMSEAEFLETLKKEQARAVL